MTEDLGECVKDDYECMEVIKNLMNLAIGHRLYGKELTGLFYRHHYFTLTCLGRQEKGTGKLLTGKDF